MKIVAPCRGEFGLKLRYHVPAVHALTGPKVVCMEPGEECLYPSADQRITVERVHDDLRRGTHPRNDRGKVGHLKARLLRENQGASWVVTRKGMPEARFIPEPHLPTKDGIDCRVVICPRKRAYGADKNWPHWKALESLPGVFAAGAPDSSDEVGCPKAWDYTRFLDASVEAMLSADLVIATDAGLAHLAVLCGRPLLLITYKGRVAPGAVRDPQGNVMQPEYWPVRLEEYYRQANHTGSPIIPVDGWEHPDEVVKQAMSILERRKVA